jgi:ureidoglycolate hydrolase
VNQIPEHLVKIGESFEQTYQPVLDFGGWKVAMLRYFDVVEPDSFYRVERHLNSNEVFILTAGKADLIVCDGDECPEGTYVFPLKLNVAYDIQQSVWHHVVMSEDAHIILVERSETGLETSDYFKLTKAQVNEIKKRFLVGKDGN